MGDRRFVLNKSGIRVGVDVGRDMDEKTFDALVAAGDLKPEPEKKAAAKPAAKK